MSTVGKLVSVGVLGVALLISSERQSLARSPGGAGPGTFGGELRGAYQVQGKVLCVGCTVKEVQKASPQHLPDLYILKKGRQQVVFQITKITNSASGRESLLGRWQAITGLTRRLLVRTDDDVWRKLIEEDNVEKDVQLTGLLQNTGTFDVSELVFLEIDNR
jgi:hypothetical protein